MSVPDGQVFISYSRSDAAFCRDLRERLATARIRTWMDAFDIPPGARWPDAIDRALNASDTILGVMTPESLESANVKNEWDWALANGRRLVLLMLRPCRVPFHYVSINYIDTTDGLDNALDELTHALATSQPRSAPDQVAVTRDPSLRCRGCGHEIVPSARFCPACATPLVGPAETDASLGAAPRPMDVTQPAASPDWPDEHPLDQVASDVFVGREQHLDQLRAALQLTLAEQSQIVLVSGEPGIGKTRLLEIFERIARHRGAAVFWGRCYEWEGAPAFWPWVQALRELIQLDDPASLRAALGAGAVDIAQIVPELRMLLPDLPVMLNLDSEQLRFRLFDGIATFLRNVARARPIVLILDDLHWADRSSLLLLQFVARELGRQRVLILGTYRDVEVGRHHPLAATLGDLARTARVQRVALRGLARDDVRNLIAQMAAIEPSDELTSAVFDATEGNPFFVTEIVRLLVSEDQLDTPSARIAWNRVIPEGVREVVGRRLDQLPEECNRTLAIAATIGREFTLALLERVSGSSAVELLDNLESAVRTRVIDEAGQIGAYRFSHALIQETLYQELSPARRVRLHRQIGEAIEALYATNLDAHLPELAHHFWQAAPAGDYARVVSVLLKAGDHAMRQIAFEEAIGHYDRALQILELDAEATDLHHCEVLLRLGHAREQLRPTSIGSEANDAFRRAAHFARKEGSAEHLAHAALGFGGINPIQTFGGLEQINLLREALSLQGQGDSILRARLSARLSTDLRIVPGTENEIIQLSDDAVQMARRLGDPATLVFTLNFRRVAQGSPDNVDQRLADAHEMVYLAHDCDDPAIASMGYFYQISDLLELGDIEAARDAFEFLRREYESYPVPSTLIRVQFVEGMWAITDWRIPVAEKVLQDRREYFGGTTSMFIRQLALLRREQARFSELADLLHASSRQNSANIPFMLLDRITGLEFATDAGDHAAARAELDDLARADFAVVRRDIYWLSSMARLSDVCATLGETKHAKALYGLFSHYADRCVSYGLGGACYGSGHYFLGRLAATLQDWEYALRHFEAALTRHVEWRMPLCLAHTRVAFADALLSRGATGDDEMARRLIDDALEVAEPAEMTRVIALARDVKGRIRGPSNG